MNRIEHLCPELERFIVLAPNRTYLLNEMLLEREVRAASFAHSQMCVDRRHIGLGQLTVQVVPERAYRGFTIGEPRVGCRHQPALMRRRHRYAFRARAR